MTGTLSFLVFDGNTEDVNARARALGGAGTGETYARVLSDICADAGRSARCVIVRPADKGHGALPAGLAVKDFDAVVWTGSALNIYDGGPEVAAQIDFARIAFDSAVPVFGSCWGLQVMSVALGGAVRANPKGREIGIGRAITLSDAGRGHPMYRGKTSPFDALTVHLDEVSAVPSGATVLAGNAVSSVQALDIRRGTKSFWGVQYHPEFDFAEIARIYRRYGDRLVEEGVFATESQMSAYVEALLDVHHNPGDMERARTLGAGADVLDPLLRTAELRNWISAKLLEAEIVGPPR